jgi:hypothetical protein
MRLSFNPLSAIRYNLTNGDAIIVENAAAHYGKQSSSRRLCICTCSWQQASLFIYGPDLSQHCMCMKAFCDYLYGGNAVHNRGPGRSINLSSFSSDNPGTQLSAQTLLGFDDNIIQGAMVSRQEHVPSWVVYMSMDAFTYDPILCHSSILVKTLLLHDGN